MSSDIDVAVLAGGPPCQQLFRAGAWREGLNGKGSHLFYHFVRVSGLLHTLCQAKRLPLFPMFENEVPGNVENIQLMTAALGLGAPIWVDAADFGECHRRRLIWCCAYWPAEWRDLITDEYDSKGGTDFRASSPPPPSGTRVHCLIPFQPLRAPFIWSP